MGEGGRLWVAQMLGVGDNDHKAHKPLHTLARCGFGCLPRVAAVCVAKTPKARAGLEGQIRGRVARCGPSKSDVQAQMLLTRAAHMTSGDKQHALEKRAAHAGMEWHKSCGVKACMVQRSKGKCTRRSLLLTETSCPRNTPRLRRRGGGSLHNHCTRTQGYEDM